MGLKKQIIENVVAPLENTHYDLTQAEVVSYNETSNRATVNIQDPRGGGMMTMRNVPVQLGSGGVHSSGPFPGDAVWISFQNRNPLFPRIISLADKDYEANTRERYSHESQGAYVTESVPEETRRILPVMEAWKNTDKERDYGYYINTDPIADLEESIRNAKYYSAKEVGMTHPENGSTIKIGDDGSISIFTGIGEGIKVDPNSHSVSIFSGKTVTNEGDVISNMANWTINCEDEIMVNAKGSITMNSDEYIIMSAKKFVFNEQEE